MRKIKESDLVGKTIDRISNEPVNVLSVYFTDGTYVELWADIALSTPGGDIPGIFLETGLGEK